MRIRSRVRAAAALLTEPKYRRWHAFVIAVALLGHLSLHYATYLPALRPVLGDLPYFRLHILHEAEFLLIVAYAGVTFRWKGAALALLATAVTSIPFILTPYVFGRQPGTDEIRDASIQVGFILLMGVLIVALQLTDAKRRELATEAVALKEADELKSRFVSIASHELKTPLTAIHGYSELLTHAKASGPERAEYARFIQSQSLRLAAMLDDLLNVSNIQAGKIPIRAERVDLQQSVQEALRLVSPGPTHPVAVDIAEPARYVSGDSARLLQVLTNLLSNAVKYSPGGGIITVLGRVEGGLVSLSVADRGLGIARAHQEQLFGTFSRIRTAETERIPGSGLGLYIVKTLVERMGGRVTLESEPGRGSTFTVTLHPATQSSQAPAKAGLAGALRS